MGCRPTKRMAISLVIGSRLATPRTPSVPKSYACCSRNGEGSSRDRRCYLYDIPQGPHREHESSALHVYRPPMPLPPRCPKDDLPTLVAICQETRLFSDTPTSTDTRPGEVVAQLRKKIEVVYEELTKSNPRIKDDAPSGNSPIHGKTDALGQERGDLLDDILIMRRLLHGLRSALHVHEDHGGSVVRDDIGHRRIALRQYIMMMIDPNPRQPLQRRFVSIQGMEPLSLWHCVKTESDGAFLRFIDGRRYRHCHRLRGPDVRPFYTNARWVDAAPE